MGVVAQDTSPGPEVEEVRLAMAWNGGVSLAVWMGGVAVELDCARRAAYGPEAEEDGRTIYRALSLAFNRMLVVDIIAGASAGGLNGALLASAIEWGRRLDPGFLRNKWLDLGDFDKLLQPTTISEPTSILQGELFLGAMKQAFVDLQAIASTTNAALPASQSALAPDPHLPDKASARIVLDVQVTNVFGKQRKFVDEWNQELVGTEFRAPVKFRRHGDYQPAALAVASRSSASFPVAFEPQELSSTVLGLADLPPVKRYAIDGGLLENAPIASAIALIPTRFAERPHRRFLCYVNAAPSLWADSDDVDQKTPSLEAVVGYVVNLPRDGRFIDQLTAVEGSMRRASASGNIQSALLAMDRPALRTTARALLPVYRLRRALASLDEAVTDPGGEPDSGTARLAWKRIDQSPDLPWIPPADAPLSRLEPWRWGVRPAQRLIHLQRDILGELYRATPLAEHGPLNVHRALCSRQLARLDRVHDAFSADVEITTNAIALAAAPDVAVPLATLRETYDELYEDGIREAVSTTLTGLHTLLTNLGSYPEAAAYRTAIFEPDAQLAGASLVEVALDRLLSIEVVRRSQADDTDIDIARELKFAQLTPEAPGRIFSPQPFSFAGPSSGEDKLTGIRLGHFAGFYRRSWRVNDYMWGRLDAAVRISDLLVTTGGTPAIPTLVDALAPEGDEPAAKDLRELVDEALVDPGLAKATVEGVAAAVAGYEQGGADFRDRLGKALAADLAAGDPPAGLFTRVVCARAAQYQVLQQELPCLDAESTQDRKLGTFTGPLGLGARKGHSLAPAIEKLRKGWQTGGTPLPRRLGRDVPEEGTSSLAMRTITHALLVAIAAVGGVAPLGRILGAVRLPVLGVGGVAARGVVQRVAVVLGFSGAAFYVTARLVSSDAETAKFGSLWDPDVLLSWVCLLGLVGVVFVPAWRGWKTSGGRRAAEWSFAVVVAVTGALLAIGLAIWQLGLAVAATTSGAFHAPHAVVVIVLAVALAGPFAVRRIKPGWLPSFFGKQIDSRTPASVVIGAAAAVLLGVSASTICDHLSDTGDWWRLVGSACVIVSTIVTAGYVVWKSSFRS